MDLGFKEESHTVNRSGCLEDVKTSFFTPVLRRALRPSFEHLYRRYRGMADQSQGSVHLRSARRLDLMVARAGMNSARLDIGPPSITDMSRVQGQPVLGDLLVDRSD